MRLGVLDVMLGDGMFDVFATLCLGVMRVDVVFDVMRRDAVFDVMRLCVLGGDA